MRSLHIGSFALVVSVLVACGGDDGSGVDRGKQLGELTADEYTTLCEYSVAAGGGEGAMHDCGGGIEVTTESVAECVADGMTAYADCDVTVGNWEDCTDGLAGDPCRLFSNPPAACQPILDCAFGGAAAAPHVLPGTTVSY